MNKINTSKLEKKYDKLLEKKEEIEDYAEWIKGFHKKINIGALITLGISTIMTTPLILDMCGKISVDAITGGLLLQLTMLGGIGAAISGITLVGAIPLFGIFKLWNKVRAKNNQININKLKRQLGRKRETTPQKETQPAKTSSYSSTIKTLPKKEVNSADIQKTSIEPQKYSYKPTNNEEKFDPSQYIKVIDGKAVWIGPATSNNNAKSRNLIRK